jgi:hypothetical protein
MGMRVADLRRLILSEKHRKPNESRSRSQKMEKLRLRVSVFITLSYNANKRRVSTFVCILGKRQIHRWPRILQFAQCASRRRVVLLGG